MGWSLGPAVRSVSSKSRRLLTLLIRCGFAIAAALSAAACASSTIGPPTIVVATNPAPAGACHAAPLVQPQSKIYQVPIIRSAASQSRCSVQDMALATHVAGQFRSIYGPDAGPIAPSEAINPVIDRLKREAQQACPAGRRGCEFRILIFAHGGLVAHEGAVLSAESLAPAMIADGYAPVFLIWTSDFFTAYNDRLCCVLEGKQDPVKPHTFYFFPVRLAGDVSASGARALENYGQQVIRFRKTVIARSGNEYFLEPTDRDLICNDVITDGVCPAIVFPFPHELAPAKILNGLDQPIPEGSAKYVLGFVPRLASTDILPEVGAEAWDNMVRRTRLALDETPATIEGNRQVRAMANLQAPGTPTASAVDCAALTENRPDKEYRDDKLGSAGRGIAAKLTPEGHGAFLVFFNRLSCEIAQGHFVDAGGKEPVRVRLYFYGHSMGALVGNEILLRHPELPWRRIVYMAAATPVRDVRQMVAPMFDCTGSALRGGWCLDPNASDYIDLRFFNLMLHPLAESHDLEVNGLVPEGSLLEWIDEMFGGPKTVDDRMFGKWTNVESTIFTFPMSFRRRATFRVFPAQSVTHGRVDPLEERVFERECAPSSPAGASVRCHPITHGEFAIYSFWRDQFLCAEDDCDRMESR